MKKIFKILIGVFLFLIALIIIIPFAFEDKIVELIKQTANNNMNATLDFEEADLSIFSSFPSTTVSLSGVSIVNHAPFEGDTLVYARAIHLEMPFSDLFKSDSKIGITSFVVNEADVAIKIDSNGTANYDITKKSEKNETPSKNSEGFQLGLASYQIKNSRISYDDHSSKINFELSNFNHGGNGNLSSDKSELQTQSSALISFKKDSTSYLKNNKLDLDATLAIDLKENKYRFLENQLMLNQLPLTFDGFVKINESNQEVALSFKTPSSDFKNFLALIPEVYSKNIEGVTTTGNFDVRGTLEGIIDENHVPKFSILINSNNASFKYPELPKSLSNININTEIINETGLVKDTYVNIDKLSFKIDDEVFNATAKLSNISENMKVAASLKGIVNLASLEEIYPAEAVKGVKGILDLDATTSFDMNALKNHHYEKTKTTGTFSVEDFKYESKELNSPLEVKNAEISFNPRTVNLNDFEAQLGDTDFSASGAIHNLLGFIFAKENIEGKFTVTSNTFSVNDFMVSESEGMPTDEEPIQNVPERIKIPSFLDCTIDAKANTVLYDNISLKNVSALLFIKDEKAILKNVKSAIFGGTLGLNGNVSTKDKVSKFEMDMDAKNFNIGQSFTSLEMFQALAPIAKAIDGKINSTIRVSGDLNDDLTPDLSSLNGTMLAQLLSSKITTKNTPLLQTLEQQLPFLDTKKLNLENLKTALTFKDGKVALKPFQLNYEDIEIAIAGGHGFDKSLAYDAVLNVPAKYLGKEASQLIAQLNDEESKNIKVPVSALISGKFSQPRVKTDLKAAVGNLGKQVANNQKDKLLNKGKDKITNALDNLLGKKKDSSNTDSLKKDPTKTGAKELLNNLFKRKKKKKDTTGNKP